jgi:hypothetical protein
MKVFVSSTCHDLLDMRAELYEELRALGLQCLFSDFKESEFNVLDQATISSYLRRLQARRKPWLD